MSLPSESELITEIVLLSEEDTELMTWDLYGKAAMVIGRDVKENQVDIDLGKSSYASMVDIEHAKKAYRKLSKNYHPDVNLGDKEAEERFKEVTEAYARRHRETKGL